MKVFIVGYFGSLLIPVAKLYSLLGGPGGYEVERESRKYLASKAANPYLASMSFIKDVSIVGGFKDFGLFLRQSSKERIIPAILAIMIPGIIIAVFIIDSKINTAPPDEQEVLYIESWPLSRSDEEILADRWAIQCKKDKFVAERVESVRKLARLSGMDPEKIEREQAERRAELGITEVKRPDGLKC